MEREPDLKLAEPLFRVGDLVKLKWDDDPVNAPVVKQVARVVEVFDNVLPFWIDVLYQDRIYRIQGYNCYRLPR